MNQEAPSLSSMWWIKTNQNGLNAQIHIRSANTALFKVYINTTYIYMTGGNYIMFLFALKL